MRTRSNFEPVVPGLIASLGLVLLTAAGTASAQPAAVGEAAPDFVLKSTSGSNLRLSEYRGEVVAVAFWASWCGECRDRLEQLEALTERYGEAGLATLAVSLDGDRERARDAAESMRTALPVLFDDAGQVGEIYAADSIPMVAVVDREGVLRGVYTGRGDDVGLELRENLRDLLRE